MFLVVLSTCHRLVFNAEPGKRSKNPLHNRNLNSLEYWIDFVPLLCLLEHQIHWHNNKILKDIAFLQNYHWYNILVWVSNNSNISWLVHIHNSLICPWLNFWGYFGMFQWFDLTYQCNGWTLGLFAAWHSTHLECMLVPILMETLHKLHHLLGKINFSSNIT